MTLAKLVEQLMERYDLDDFQAAGIVGNLAYESNGLKELREKGQPEGKGGYGWGQWTGPRRITFLRWAQLRKIDWREDDANWSYLVHELDGQYAMTIAAVAKSKSVPDATAAFERGYEKAGFVNMPARVRWAQIALRDYNGMVSA